jgi:acetylglutamate kinase
MGPFPNSEGCEYILVAIDYVSKWVEALPCHIADTMHSKKMFHEVIFLRYRVPRIVISYGGSYFIDGHSGKLSRKLELITGLPLHITLRRTVK